MSGWEERKGRSKMGRNYNERVGKMVMDVKAVGRKKTCPSESKPAWQTHGKWCN